jgi:small subunit ribosomal protein S20
VAHSLSAKKRIRQNTDRRSRNRWRKTQIRDARKEFDEAILHGSADQASEKLRVLTRVLDKIAAKGTIHKNAAARRKARAAILLNKKLVKTEH